MAIRMMKLNRDFTLRSTYGSSVRFEKGVAVTVPPLLWAEALASGAEFSDGEGLPAEPERTDKSPIDPTARAAAILEAVTAIVVRNKKAEFTAANSPKVEAVIKEAGFDVYAKEVAVALQGYYDAQADKNA